MANEEKFQYLDSKSNPQEITFQEGDFNLTQMGVRLTDTKMKSKPTTFFKDALRRFAKNKSSVIGAIILGTILVLTLLLPSVMSTNITVSPLSMKQTYLPPKLFNAGTGWWDGTEKIENKEINFDWDRYDADGTYSGLPASGYPVEGIVNGEAGITYSKVGERKTNATLAFARGGDIRLTVPEGVKKDAEMRSYPVDLDLAANDYSIDFDISALPDDFEFGEQGEYSISLLYYLTSSVQPQALVAVNSISIASSDGSNLIAPDQTLQLNATILPENASDRSLTWSSDHPDCVDVDEFGMITGIKQYLDDNGDPASVTITATANDGSNKKGIFKVDVDEGKPAPAQVDVASVTIFAADDATFVTRDQTLQLRAEVLPANATNSKVTWGSSNEEAATVDEFGLVRGLSEAEGVEITATSLNGMSDTYQIDVVFNGTEYKTVLVEGNEGKKVNVSLEDNEDILNNLSASADKAITAQLEVSVKAAEDKKARSMLLKKAIFSSESAMASEKRILDARSLKDANATLSISARNTNGTFNENYWSCPSGIMSLFRADYVTGTFVYDAYEAIYGLRSGQRISRYEMKDYVSKGWIECDDIETFRATIAKTPSASRQPLIDAFQASFKMTELGLEKCPLLIDEDHPITIGVKSAGGMTALTFTGSIYFYRYYGYESMPRFLFGTDGKGRDMLRLVFNGLRTSFILGLVTSLVNFVFGLVWGAISGYFGGWTDIAMERFCDILHGVPWIVVMTLILVNFRGKGLSEILLLGIALCATGWLGTAGLTRTQFYRFKNREYILAARTLGAKDFRLIFRHILPNAVGTIITSAVLMIPSTIFSESSLTFIGLLNSLDSFGFTLAKAQAEMGIHSYILIFPSVIMALVMISFNLFGNGLRDAFNPSLKGGE